MWTATINGTGVITEGTYVDVDFSNSVSTVTERCIPQDMDGFKHWVRSRLATFNMKEQIEALGLQRGSAVDVSDPVVVKTADQIARETWFAGFYRLQQAQKLIDLGIILTTNAKVVALRDQLKTTIRPEYIDSL